MNSSILRQYPALKIVFSVVFSLFSKAQESQVCGMAEYGPGAGCQVS